MAFLPVSNELFFKRNEAKDPRWGEKVLATMTASTEWILRGYPDDEGISLNGGRLGASQAPEHIRRAFYKTTWQDNLPILTDLGDLDTKSFTLAERHSYCRDSLKGLLQAGKKAICLGGGHDYGFPDGAGFLEACKTIRKSIKPVIINFDAHLDVRPLDRGLSSGTPFFRLLTEYENFDFYQIGIQPQCNSKSYYDWCLSQGGKILSWPQVLTQDDISLKKQVAALVNSSLIQAGSNKPPAYISLDIDVFANAVAPGCSQSWPTGIDANSFYPVLEFLKQSFDIQVFGIYEVSPPLDQDSRTAKLAAQWIHQLLNNN